MPGGGWCSGRIMSNWLVCMAGAGCMPRVGGGSCMPIGGGIMRGMFIGGRMLLLGLLGLKNGAPPGGGASYPEPTWRRVEKKSE